MADLNVFLTDFFGRYALSKASPGIRRRYDDLKVKGLLTSDQEKIDDTLPVLLAGTTPPQPINETNELYNALRAAFIAMDDDRNALRGNKDASDFLKAYFGDNKTFPPFTPDTNAFVPKGSILQQYLIAYKNEIAPQLGMSSADYDGFLIKIETYNNIEKDRKLQKKLESALSIALNKLPQDINAMKLYDVLTSKPTPRSTEDTLKILELESDYAGILKFTPTVPRLKGIQTLTLNKFNAIKTDIKDTYNDKFNTDYDKILKDIATKEKVQEVIFPRLDYDISEPIQKGLSSSSFISKLQPLDHQKPTVLQKVSDKLKHATKDDFLGKLTNRHARHNYVMDKTAKPIVDAILNSKGSDGKAFARQGGLKEVMARKDAITKKLETEAPGAVKHFEYFIKQLDRYSKTSEREFAGALKNGKQLRTIVYGIAEEAAAADKEDEAKTALEVLAMLRYDNTTSDSWDEWKKNPLDLFKGTSFDKEGPLRFLATATSKTINAGVNALFWGGVVAKNKFTGRAKKFSEASDQVKGMTKAKQYAASKSNDVTMLEAEENNAKTAYEIAYNAPDKNDREVKEAKKKWDQAKLARQYAEQTIEFAGGKNIKDATDTLSKQQRLMLFWDYVNGGKGTTDLRLFRSNRQAQNSFNQAGANGKEELLKKFMDDHSLAA